MDVGVIVNFVEGVANDVGYDLLEGWPVWVMSTEGIKLNCARTDALCSAASMVKDNLMEGTHGVRHGVLNKQSTALEQYTQLPGLKVGDWCSVWVGVGDGCGCFRNDLLVAVIEGGHCCVCGGFMCESVGKLVFVWSGTLCAKSCWIRPSWDNVGAVDFPVLSWVVVSGRVPVLL
eukprot:9745140-Ditylum_brightwellii.AAC.1